MTTTLLLYYAQTAALPIVAAIIYGRRILRRKARELERNGGVEPMFAPVDPPEPGWLLRHFSAPARAILRQRRSTTLGFAFGIAYVLAVLLSGGLLSSLQLHFGLPGGGARSVWHSYLITMTNSSSAYSIFAMMLAFFAVADIALPTSAVFMRTRPVSRRMLYWQRVLPSLASLVAGFGLAVGISVLALLATHGPVYKHLYDASSIHIASDPDAAEDIARTLQTSAPRIFLSMGLTLLFVFSLAVTAFLQPFVKGRSRVVFGLVIVYASIIGPSFLAIFLDETSRFTRYLFLYTHLGPPPPYCYALIPLALSGGLLLLGSVFNERFEP